MIRIKPSIDYSPRCPHCSRELSGSEVLWQGIHVCVVAKCIDCESEIVTDLPVGHASDGGYQADLSRRALFGPKERRTWFGEPLLRSLSTPQPEVAPFRVTKRSGAKDVLLLNCLDFLYGHSLLKLLNLGRHLKSKTTSTVGVIVPKCLEWMVPEDVDEIWVVDLPLSSLKKFYPDLQRKIENECRRFETVFISRALSHPWDFDISAFVGVTKHDFTSQHFRITFIWREDRLWHHSSMAHRMIARTPLSTLLLWLQRRKVISLFSRMRPELPGATFTVAGLGGSGRFPEWIEDHRTGQYDDKTEKHHCQIYSQSRLVIGVHGSNMLLPSGLGGLTIDLMPDDRWGNYAQDILYQEPDDRIASFRYRFVPIGVGLLSLAKLALSQVRDYDYFRIHMMSGKA